MRSLSDRANERSLRHESTSLMLRKKDEFEWGMEAKEAFLEIKDAITKQAAGSIKTHYYVNAIRCILLQENDEELMQPIAAFMSHAPKKKCLS